MENWIKKLLQHIRSNIGNPEARTNFQDLENMIGIPDAADSNLDDMLRTGFDSGAITADAAGSVLEREQFLQEGLATVQGDITDIKAVTDVIPDAGALTTLQGDITDIKAITDVIPDAGALTTLQGDVTDILAVTAAIPDAGALTTLQGDITDILAVTAAIPDAGALTTLQGDVTDILAVTAAIPDAGALTTLQSNVTDILAVTAVIPDLGALTTLQSNVTDIKAVTDVTIVALGTDGTTVTDSALSVLGAIGANNANNDFLSDDVTADEDGSVLEREQFIQEGLATAQGDITDILAVTAAIPDAGALTTLQGNVTDILAVTAAIPDAGALTTLQGDVTDILAVTAAIPDAGALTTLQGNITDILAVTAVIPDAGALTTLQSNVTDILAVTSVIPDAGALTTLQSNVTDIKAVTDVIPDAGALTTLQSNVTDIKAVTDVLPDAGALTTLQSNVTDIKAVTDVVIAALGTDGTTVTDSALSVLGAVGANNANNVFDSGDVLFNVDGSILEKEEFLSKIFTNSYVYTSSAASTTTITAAVLVDQANQYIGQVVIPLTREMTGEARYITAYNGTDTLTVSPAWALNPDTTGLAQFVIFSTGLGIVPTALGTDGTTVTDSATTVLGAIGANNANNVFSSVDVLANEDGSVLERLEQIQEAVNVGTGTSLAANKSLVDVLGSTGAAHTFGYDPASVLGDMDGNHRSTHILFVIPEAVASINAHNIAIRTIVSKFGVVHTITQGDALNYPNYAEYNLVVLGTENGTVWATANLAGVKVCLTPVVCCDAISAAYMAMGSDGGTAAAKTVINAIANIKACILGIGAHGWTGLGIGANTIAGAGTSFATLDMSGATITETWYAYESVNANTDVVLGVINMIQADATHGVDSADTEIPASRAFYGPAYSFNDLNSLGQNVLGLLCEYMIQQTTTGAEVIITGDIGNLQVKILGNQQGQFTATTPLVEFIAGQNTLGTKLAAGKSLVDALGTNGTTVADSAVTVLGAIGANNNDNAFASNLVAANAIGSVLEREQFLQEGLATAQGNVTDILAVTAAIPDVGAMTSIAQGLDLATVDGIVDNILLDTQIRTTQSGIKAIDAAATKYLSIDSGTNGAEILSIAIEGLIGHDWTVDVYIPAADAEAASQAKSLRDSITYAAADTAGGLLGPLAIPFNAYLDFTNDGINDQVDEVTITYRSRGVLTLAWEA